MLKNIINVFDDPEIKYISAHGKASIKLLFLVPPLSKQFELNGLTVPHIRWYLNPTNEVEIA